MSELENIFKEVLQLEEHYDNYNNLKMEEVLNWDSLAHITLISDIEATFEIDFLPEEILKFNTFESCLIILNEKGIKLDD